MPSAHPMVIDSALAKAPTSPLRKPSGTNTIMVARLDPVSGGMNSCPAGRTAPRPTCGPPGDVLDHDDDIINDEADRRGDAAESHDVEALAQRGEQQHGAQERRRDH